LELKPVAGVQLKVPAPVAVNTTELPLHKVLDCVAEGLDTVTVGVATTVMVLTALLVHEFAAVPITV